MSSGAEGAYLGVGKSTGIATREARRQVWFIDTSALITMAIHPPLQRYVVGILSKKHRILAKAIVDELAELARWADTPLRKWAKTAMEQLGWLGDAVLLDEPVGIRLAAQIQEELAAGRPLRHDLEHWGEAATIAIASRAQIVQPLFLSDDYNARVAAHTRGVKALGIHKLLHLLIKRGALSSSQAVDYSDALTAARRASDYTEKELIGGDLGRAGRP